MPPVGTMEILVILIAVILFGPKRIPEIARTLGAALNQLRSASDDLMRELTKEVDLEKPPLPKKAQETQLSPQRGHPAEKPAGEEVKALTHEQLAEAARKLGLSVEGKTEDQLRAEIVSRVSLDGARSSASGQKAG